MNSQCARPEDGDFSYARLSDVYDERNSISTEVVLQRSCARTLGLIEPGMDDCRGRVRNPELAELVHELHERHRCCRGRLSYFI